MVVEKVVEKDYDKLYALWTQYVKNKKQEE